MAEARDFHSIRLSPGGQQAAVVVGDGTSSKLWIYDVAAGFLTPLPTDGDARSPTWSPDGRRILYVSTHAGSPQREGRHEAGTPRSRPWSAAPSAGGVINGTDGPHPMRLHGDHRGR